MKANPTPEELHDANTKAQTEDDEQLADDGTTYVKVMEHVETIDKMSGVTMAFKGEGATIHIRTDDISETVAELIGCKYDYEIDTESDSIDATVDVSEPSESEDDETSCPECGGVDLKEGVAFENPNKTADYGCRDCRHVWMEG